VRQVVAALFPFSRRPDPATNASAKKRAGLVEALHGRIRNHHRGLLKVHLDLVTALQHGLAESAIDTQPGADV